MLAHLPDEPFVRKVPGCFPRDAGELLDEFAGRVDAILAYSVLQYVFVEAAAVRLRRCVPGAAGPRRAAADRRRAEREQAKAVLRVRRRGPLPPGVHRDGRCPGRVVQRAGARRRSTTPWCWRSSARARAAGFDAYVVPQAADLPMANRREDILIVAPVRMLRCQRTAS